MSNYQDLTRRTTRALSKVAAGDDTLCLDTWTLLLSIIPLCSADFEDDQNILTSPPPPCASQLIFLAVNRY